MPGIWRVVLWIRMRIYNGWWCSKIKEFIQKKSYASVTPDCMPLYWIRRNYAQVYFHTHTQFRGSLNLERLWHLMPIELVLFRHNTEWSHLFTETKASCDFISINNKSHSSEQSEKQNASVIVIRMLRYASQQRGSTGPFNTFYVYATHLIYIVWVMRWGTNNVPCLNLSKWCVIPADTPSVPV